MKAGRSYLLLLMILGPVLSFSQNDTRICLPVPVIDSIILELQELDYLVEKSKVDSVLIQVQAAEIITLQNKSQVLSEKTELLNQVISNEKAHSDQVEKEKRFWKWGGIGVSGLLAILLLL